MGKYLFLTTDVFFARISRNDQAAALVPIAGIGISIYLLRRFY